MSFNDFAVQLYLTILAIAAAPIVLSWVLRRVAGEHAPKSYPNNAIADSDLYSDETDEAGGGGLVRSSYNPNSTGYNIWVEAD